MAKSYLSNDRIYLRALEPEDLNILYRIENNPDLWEVSSITVPYSRYVLKQYIEQSLSDIFADKQLRLMIVRHTNHTVLGTIDMTDYAPLHARAAVGIAVLQEYRREGYAKDALTLLCEYAFGFLNARQLYAHIPADNEASLRLFSSCGFQVCGRLKDWLRVENNFKDVVMMQRLNDIKTV